MKLKVSKHYPHPAPKGVDWRVVRRCVRKIVKGNKGIPDFMGYITVWTPWGDVEVSESGWIVPTFYGPEPEVADTREVY